MSSTVEKYKHASVIKCVRSIQFDAIANSDQKWPLSIQEGVLLPTVCMVIVRLTPKFSHVLCGCCSTGRLKKELDEWVGGEDGWVGGWGGWVAGIWDFTTYLCKSATICFMQF